MPVIPTIMIPETMPILVLAGANCKYVARSGMAILAPTTARNSADLCLKSRSSQNIPCSIHGEYMLLSC